METLGPTVHVHSAKEIGLAIRKCRKNNGLTLTDVAGLTNVGIRFLSELENGKPTVRLDKLLRVANAMGLQLLIVSPPDPRTEKVTK